MAPELYDYLHVLSFLYLPDSPAPPELRATPGAQSTAGPAGIWGFSLLSFSISPFTRGQGKAKLQSGLYQVQILVEGFSQCKGGSSFLKMGTERRQIGGTKRVSQSCYQQNYGVRLLNVRLSASENATTLKVIKPQSR